MVTLHDAHLARWNAIKNDIAYNPEHAIPTYFRAHPELGSPLGAEIPLEDGGVAQAFSGGVVTWQPGGGVQLATS